jgi:hypothetical protein
MRAFWYTATCSLFKVHRRFRGAYCLHHHGYERNVPEDCHLNIRHRESLKPHYIKVDFARMEDGWTWLSGVSNGRL